MRRRVLVVDDSADVHELVAVWLLEEELELLRAEDGAACLALAAAERPDLILLDVDLPGTDGLEVCRRLKADPATREMPVVFLSGATSAEVKLAGLEAGAVDYITKPFDPAELRARVRASLRTKQLMDELAAKAAVLRDSEERFRVLAENSSDVIARHAPDGTFVYVSPACAVILGHDPAEVIGRPLGDFVHPDDRAGVEACWRGVGGDGAARTAEFGEPGRAATATREYRFCFPDGRQLWVESTFRPIADGQGRVTEIHSSSRDVSARKQAESREAERSGVLELIARDSTPREVVGRLIEAAERAHGGAASVVLLEDGALTHVAPRLPRRLASAIEANLYRFASAFCSRAAAAAGPVIAVDVASDTTWAEVTEAAAECGLHRVQAALIRLGRDEVLGMFALYTPGNETVSGEGDAPAGEFLTMAARLIAVSAEHHQLNGRLSYQARHDALTGLPNRALFEERVRETLVRSAAGGRAAAVCYIDLDRFKQINDTLGHHAGDALLCQLVLRLRENLRDSDTLARMGGDEFAVILPDLATAEEAVPVLKALVAAMGAPFDVLGHEIHATLSIGMAAYPRDGRDAVTLQKNADVALYQVKNGGRNGMACFSPEMNATAMQRLKMEVALRQAIAAGEIRPHYQVQVNQAGEVVGVEALARWRHAELGDVMPDVFIALAEESGLIAGLGRSVLRAAVAQARRWQDAGHFVRVAVNVSAQELMQADFAVQVEAALAEARLEGRWLELELTETAVMQGGPEAAERLAALKRLGVGLAIDDFGTGYSSLAYLQRLEVDTIKVDRSFVREIETADPSPVEGAILRAVAAMAQAMGVALVAEGVEIPAQREFLRAIGCPVMQGYLFGRPVAAEKVVFGTGRGAGAAA